MWRIKHRLEEGWTTQQPKNWFSFGFSFGNTYSFKMVTIMTLYRFSFIIRELPWNLGKDSEVESHCLFQDLEFIVIFLDWLPPKSTEPSLLSYLNHSWMEMKWIHPFIKVIHVKVNAIDCLELEPGLPISFSLHL